MASLGELERAVMEPLWAADGPLAATTLRDELADRGVALTTVHTVLTRLEQKGFVQHDEARPRRFSAARQPGGPRRRAHARGARPVRRPAGRAGPVRRQRRRRRGARCCASCSPARTTPLTRPPSPCCPPPPSSLAVLAALLAWPVPALLARARWPRRDPLAALVCWQAIGLAGGLSIIGALLVHGLAPWGTRCRRRGGRC